MSNLFAKLLDEGNRQQKEVQQQAPVATPKAAIYPDVEGDSMTARQQPVDTASRRDSTTARQHDSTHEYLASFLEAKATNKTTLRYPPALMAEIDEVIYQIKRTHGVNLSKNSVFILALASVLYDFKHDASRSLLFKELIQSKRE